MQAAGRRAVWATAGTGLTICSARIHTAQGALRENPPISPGNSRNWAEALF